MRGVVEYVETLGSEVLAHVVIGEAGGATVTMLARMPARGGVVAAPGSAVFLRVSPTHVHLFDVKTGARVSAASP